jgi:hypothetical protein
MNSIFATSPHFNTKIAIKTLQIFSNWIQIITKSNKENNNLMGILYSVFYMYRKLEFPFVWSHSGFKMNINFYINEEWFNGKKNFSLKNIIILVNSKKIELFFSRKTNVFSNKNFDSKIQIQSLM